jgi:hypothetical protein
MFGKERYYSDGVCLFWRTELFSARNTSVATHAATDSGEEVKVRSTMSTREFLHLRRLSTPACIMSS